MQLASPTVLLLDDDAQFRAGVIPALEAQGLRVISATKGRVARELIEEEPPDLVIVDGLLPDTNGIEWIEQLREDGLKTPIIFVSAFYRDLATFRHLTRDLDVISVFHKPLAIGRFARDVVDLVTQNHEPLPEPPKEEPAPPPKRTESYETVVFPDDDALTSHIDELRAEYARELPLSAGKLADTVSRLRTEGQRPSLVFEALRQAHDMHGTAGSYGYRKASQAAAHLETELRAFQDSGRINWDNVDAAVTTLEHHAALNDSAEQLDDRGISGVTAAPPPTSAATWLLTEGAEWSIGPKVLVLEDDPAMVAYLRSAVEDTLIQLDAASTCDEALSLADSLQPSVAIVGWPLSDPDQAPGFIEHLRARPGCELLPVLMISVEDDPAMLKKATAWGVDLFLPQPIDGPTLQRAIRTLSARTTVEPPKIAVLHDHEAVSRLLSAGIQCLGYASLRELLDDMPVFRPQVIIIGHDVEDTTVARTIRMIAWDVDVSILVFSGGRTQEAFEADGFLSRRHAWEPSAIRWAQTVARSRDRAASCPDTGLFRRDVTVAALEAGLAAAQREGRSYAVAIIEPARLDSLNEIEANCVRHHVAQFIGGRFRAEDARGLWDESKYILGFEGPDAETLVAVLRRFQAEARNQPAQLGHTELDSSVSIGLASYPLDGDTVRELLATAFEHVQDAGSHDRDALVWQRTERG